MRIFVINPGSTSTKLAVYEDGEQSLYREYQHDKAEMIRFDHVTDQHGLRMEAIRNTLKDAGLDGADFDAVAARGGLLHPLEGGVYEVSDGMLDDLSQCRYGEHPCNLGAVLADELSREWGVPAYVVDPAVTDELMDVARITGLPGLERRSLFHALNQRNAARTVAAQLGIEYESANFIVCHMGGGVTIGAHRQGRVVDVVNGLDGEGPLTPERTGGLPVVPVLDRIISGRTTPEELRESVLRRGGLFAHLGTSDMREVVRRIEEGDGGARLVFRAQAYQTARFIASMVPALVDEHGVLDLASVVLTGGLARSEALVREITRMTAWIGPVSVVVGDEEMRALASGAERVLTGRESAKTYVRRT
ncbi:butyrate kinase [Pseudodesulfovibrio cashew]|uniref:Probable butyrate kinase n=1 Tax=Pseudodesulfovibrio cashew TaxID=2678688 RepID=A0A6I6JF04_9BACT|nr:butyrate kinase [Pseudodesulfovibrio cashew]QGY39598.1 butyrate kinase [Pseudodesulfovibrio cashew]